MLFDLCSKPLLVKLCYVFCCCDSITFFALILSAFYLFFSLWNKYWCKYLIIILLITNLAFLSTVLCYCSLFTVMIALALMDTEFGEIKTSNAKLWSTVVAMLKALICKIYDWKQLEDKMVLLTSLHSQLPLYILLILLFLFSFTLNYFKFIVVQSLLLLISINWFKFLKCHLDFH